MTLAVLILFGPLYYGCSTGAVRPGQTPGPVVCRSASFIEVQGDHLFPAPLLWFALWALAPGLAVIGTWTGDRAVATWLIAIAILADLTSIISIGGGFVFALTLIPLLVFALMAARRTASPG
jgi:hypothetical protein